MGLKVKKWLTNSQFELREESYLQTEDDKLKMCLKLAYFAFSSSPSKDAMMSTFCGFSSLFVEV